MAGFFERGFLTLPQEVLTTTLIHHQHYFPVVTDSRRARGGGGVVFVWWVCVVTTLRASPAFLSGESDRQGELKEAFLAVVNTQPRTSG